MLIASFTHTNFLIKVLKKHISLYVYFSSSGQGIFDCKLLLEKAAVIMNLTKTKRKISLLELVAVLCNNRGTPAHNCQSIIDEVNYMRFYLRVNR